MILEVFFYLIKALFLMKLWYCVPGWMTEAREFSFVSWPVLWVPKAFCKHILLHHRFFRERTSRARVVFCPQLFKRYKSNENQLRYPLDRDKSTLWTTEGWGPFFEIPEILLSPGRSVFQILWNYDPYFFSWGRIRKLGIGFMDFDSPKMQKKKKKTN